MVPTSKLGGAGLSFVEYVQFMAHWKVCPHTVQSSWPTPPFLSSWTVTDSSWLQKRQVNFLGRGSRCEMKYISQPWKGGDAAEGQMPLSSEGAFNTFLGPWGARVLFFRLPMATVARGLGLAQCVSGRVMNEGEERGRSGANVGQIYLQAADNTNPCPAGGGRSRGIL